MEIMHINGSHSLLSEVHFMYMMF